MGMKSLQRPIRACGGLVAEAVGCHSQTGCAACCRDFDLVVIGGGSGGLACGREVRLSCSTRCFIPPAPTVTRARTGGGTEQAGGGAGFRRSKPARVEMGPGRDVRQRWVYPEEDHAHWYAPMLPAVKTAMRSRSRACAAGLVGQALMDAPSLGWQVDAKPSHDWQQLRTTVLLAVWLLLRSYTSNACVCTTQVQNYVRSSNFGYVSALMVRAVRWLCAPLPPLPNPGI